ncbi:MAG TPA: TA system VapC family ribonuclease toxin [Polyangiaceae bacterium]
MIAVDTNILVYAHRKDSPWHAKAREAVTDLAQGRARWALPWPCVHEFFAVVTHPRIYAPPSSMESALEQIEAWLESPSVEPIGEDVGYWAILREAVRSGKVEGARVHDARIASLCALHGVRELWSADRDFSRFPDLTTRNPLQSG